MTVANKGGEALCHLKKLAAILDDIRADVYLTVTEQRKLDKALKFIKEVSK